MKNDLDKKQRLLNVYVNNLTMQETIQCIQNILEGEQPAYLVEINVDVLMKVDAAPRLKQIVDEADLVLVDGQPLCWISHWIGTPVKERVAGSDLVPQLCGAVAKKGKSIFIMGGREGVAVQAATNMQKQYPGLQIAGTYAPPFGFEKKPEELQKIREAIQAAQPDLLFVCLGCPKQEYWVYDNFKTCGAKMTICAGAAVDFMAGRIKRAPKWVSKCGFEWFYRFLHEPQRLFKRYFWDDMWGIIALVLKYGRKEKK